MAVMDHRGQDSSALAAGGQQFKSFNDVAEGLHFTTAAAWAFENRITTAKSATVFAPDAATRVEFAAFLSRYDNLN